MNSQEKTLVFDYRVTRFVMGLIALTLPFVVRIISGDRLSSISASYYTCARNEFVGMLFIVGSFLLAYNGYRVRESLASKAAALAAIIVALCPTNCDTCRINSISRIHFTSATILLLVLTYFCFGPFSRKAKEKNTTKARRRRKVYITCGVVMIGCILTVAVLNMVLPGTEVTRLRITYWSESAALVAFGICWMTASKTFRVIADKDEIFMLFKLPWLQQKL